MKEQSLSTHPEHPQPIPVPKPQTQTGFQIAQRQVNLLLRRESTVTQCFMAYYMSDISCNNVNMMVSKTESAPGIFKIIKLPFPKNPRSPGSCLAELIIRVTVRRKYIHALKYIKHLLKCQNMENMDVFQAG